MQVLAALGMGVVGVPAGSYGSKGLDILLVALRVEDQIVANGLEERKIRVGLHGLLVNIVKLHILFIGIDDLLDAVVGTVDGD